MTGIYRSHRLKVVADSTGTHNGVSKDRGYARPLTVCFHLKMSFRWHFFALACFVAAAHAFAQTTLSQNADQLQKQCTGVADYSKLPNVQADECEAWAQQQQEALAQMHIGGIEEADDDARDSAKTAFAQVKPLLAELSPAQRSAYGHLVTSFHRFLAVQVSGGYLYLPPYAPAEWDNGGEFASEYLHAQFDVAVAHAIVHRTDLPGSYVGDSASERRPSKPLPSLAKADAQLNAAWRRLQSHLVGSDQATSFVKLQIEQRAWLAFRDAFVNFAAEVSPSVPRSVWAASLEANRTDALSLVDSMNHQTQPSLRSGKTKLMLRTDRLTAEPDR